MTRTRVYLTIDTECAEERVLPDGRVLPPQGYDLRVWGRFAGRGDELGLRAILSELEAARVCGTFFVEPFGGDFFGREELRNVCSEILGRGHDVQLHVHPVQRRPDWRRRGESAAPDDMAAYPEADQVALIQEGLGLLSDAGVPRQRLLGFRAGNFGASNDTLRALATAGLRVDSSYNPCYFARGGGRGCKIDWPTREAGLFDTGCGVWELPVANFVEPGGGFRHLQIMAVSLAEMIACLEQARALGIGEVTIVTHSFELFHIDSIEMRRGRPNRVNRARLRGLCRFLAARERDFEVETVGALAARLPAPAPKSAAAAGGGMGRPLPRGTRLRRTLRLIEQAYKRAEARLPL